MKDKLSLFLKEECFRLETDNSKLTISTGFMFKLALVGVIIATVVTT